MALPRGLSDMFGESQPSAAVSPSTHRSKLQMYLLMVFGGVVIISGIWVMNYQPVKQDTAPTSPYQPANHEEASTTSSARSSYEVAIERFQQGQEEFQMQQPVGLLEAQQQVYAEEAVSTQQDEALLQRYRDLENRYQLMLAEVEKLKQASPSKPDPISEVEKNFKKTERLRALSSHQKRETLVFPGQNTVQPENALPSDPSHLVQAVKAKAEQLTGQEAALMHLKTQVGQVQPSVLTANGTGGIDGLAKALAQQPQGLPPRAAAQPVVQATPQQDATVQLAGKKRLPPGTVINAVLNEYTNSDYLGSYRAIVTHDVYDIVYENVLIPKGTEIMGRSIASSGPNAVLHNRLGLPATQFILPDGSPINLKNKVTAKDRGGIAAIKGSVDYHIWEQFLGVTAYAIVSSSADSDRSSTISGSTEIRGDMEEGLREQTSPLVQKYLNIVPTKELDLGTPMKIVLDDYLYLTPWSSIFDDYLTQH
ncbi:TrbI/VirB10 family protein [Zooshikella ganghwensis]|uniref:TrbI/VirB10 family protein n=1 Tax=Zooshikella ganghwensis TaxID=202772 RepID=A0A4P9VG02_9GAMM|nr:TrbI/VirB10 family protein [Zooshikella ganghwensis]RDH41326.1 TrbI/VirB10 family protein [Zooshikella ganghwensis]